MSPSWQRDPPRHGARRDEAGSIATLLGLAVAVGLLVLVLLVDLTAYLAAASRAQAAADAAAMAAVTVADPRGRTPGDPTTAAEEVAHAASARLEVCVCRRGTTHAHVEVSVAVPGLVVTRLAGQRVRATSEAELRPPSAAPTPDTRGTSPRQVSRSGDSRCSRMRWSHASSCSGEAPDRPA